MVNRLADATSPYLLQHKDNPVDWHQWDEAAFAEACERDVPVLLSVGYASCHWCHVMAHESFEDDETAADMNRLFVNIKVDREERPDVDRIYMDAVQAMTGRGGWPMTVFLTPDARPFFAGTYFPNEDRHGHPSFRKVLAAVSHAWHERRDEIDGQASRLAEIIQSEIPPVDDLPTVATLQQAYESLVAAHDPVNGGFGSAPKFPQAPTLEFLMRIARQPWAPEAAGMLHRSLTAMARGGIYDHLAGGFSRYSVDDEWLVPHFEKMLYDNALLARLYAHAWRLTGDERFEAVARETLDYMLRDLGLPGGGFASAEDADSEGVEGKFYAFTHDEFMANGGERVAVAARYFGVTPDGNFEGANVLHEAATLDEVAATTGLDPTEVRAAVDAARRLLLEARSARVRPERDDKAITAWNGLALRALADAGWILDDERYIDEARGAAEFILGRLRLPDGRLMRSRRGDRAGNPGYCDDYAAAAVGLFSLYQATGEPRWFEEARSLTTTMIDLFSDGEAGFFATAHDAEQLIARPKNLYDNPTPSDNSLAAEALLHVEALSGPTEAKLLDGVFRVAGQLIRHPMAAGHLLALAATRLQPPLEVAIVGDPTDDRTKSLLGETRDTGHSGVFLAFGDPGAVPLLQDRPLVEGHPAAYVCRGFACDAPVTGAGDLRRALSGDSARND